MIKSRVWLEVSKARVTANVETIMENISPLKLMAVVKADAYGIGVEAVAELLAETGVGAFGVAEVNKACLIKRHGIPVHILGALIDKEVPTVVEEGFVAPIGDLRIAEVISNEAIKQGKKAICQFKIDTGMGRLGILADEALEVIEKVRALPGLDIRGIYSHFPSAYNDPDYSMVQVEKFKDILAQCEKNGMKFEFVHIANSDGIHMIPDATKPPFTMAGSGINLYGIYDSEGIRAFDLHPVFQLKSRLVAVRNLPAGSSIGYGRSAVLEKDARIGTVAIGYADGLPFRMSENGYFYVCHKKCPIVGRISMDFTTINLDAVPEAQPGDEVLCLGKDISVYDWASVKMCTPYEVICSFGPRVARVFL